jgi:hypothetical protein
MPMTTVRLTGTTWLSVRHHWLNSFAPPPRVSVPTPSFSSFSSHRAEMESMMTTAPGPS